MAELTNEFCFVYSTYPSKELALQTARMLVDAKLAACVNIYPPMTSVYAWEDKREETAEVAMFIKTRRSLADQAIAAAWNVHSYEVPCFVILPIDGGTSDYLAWVRAQTEQPVTV